MAEKLPVKEQVDNQQDSKCQARVIVHCDPLVSWYAKVSNPAAPPSAAFRENEIQHKPGDQRRDEGDQAANIDKCVDGYAFQRKSPLSQILRKQNKISVFTILLLC